MSVKPITPAEVVSAKSEAIPDAVFEVFNQAIAESWDGSVAVVSQNEVALRIVKAMQIPMSDVYVKGYLNIEDIYREAGWRVKYNKPDFNECTEGFSATFEFSK